VRIFLTFFLKRDTYFIINYGLLYIIDIQVLDCCREESNRRLKIYHAWKNKNRNTNELEISAATNCNTEYQVEMRAPAEIFNNGELNWKL
jgi:hypothetical protein